MKEYLSEKEAVVLEHLKKHYKETGEVIFFPPLGLYDEETLNNLLTALCIRGYLMPNALTTQNRMARASITLGEKALNRFNEE